MPIDYNNSCHVSNNRFTKSPLNQINTQPYPDKSSSQRHALVYKQYKSYTEGGSKRTKVPRSLYQ